MPSIMQLVTNDNFVYNYYPNRSATKIVYEIKKILPKDIFKMIYSYALENYSFLCDWTLKNRLSNRFYKNYKNRRIVNNKNEEKERIWKNIRNDRDRRHNHNINQPTRFSRKNKN